MPYSMTGKCDIFLKFVHFIAKYYKYFNVSMWHIFTKQNPSYTNEKELVKHIKSII